MNISVLKNNIQMDTIDLGKEVEGLLSGQLAFFVGRADHCKIVLEDKSVSREHAQLTFVDGKWNIKKLAEFADILVNGNIQNSAVLKNGDVISIGQFQLICNIPEMKPAPVEIPQPVVAAPPVVEEKTQTELDTQIDEFTEENNSDAEITEAMPQEEAPVEDEFAAPEKEEDEFALNSSVNGEEDGFGAENQEAAPEGEFSQEGFASEEGGAFSNDENLPVEGDESTRVFKTFAKVELELFGEHAPYDKYTLSGNETYIGRDAEKCQIILQDPEVSSVHAVIRKNKINIELEDLQSGNGTLLNGARINQAELSNNDEFIIGSTTFTLHVYSELIEGEKDRLMPVADNQIVEIEEIVEVHKDFSEGDQAAPVEEEKSFIKRIMKDPKKKRIAMILIGLLLVMMFLDDGEEAPKDKQPKKKEAETLVDKEKEKIQEHAKKVNLTPEQQQALEATYQLGFELFQQGKYADAILELEKVKAVDPEYKNTALLIEQANEGLRKLEELEQKRKADIERKERMEKVKDLVEKAKQAVKDRQAVVAEALFGKILELDPENFDVPQLKIEIDAWKKEQERIAVEKAQKEADRKRKVGLLQPSKTFYLKKEWFNAILKLEDFLKIKDMDEDLIKEGTTMLEESKKNLMEQIAPFLGKARSLKEGQDLKGAYENYLKILDFDPVNMEAINEMNEIKDILNNRSRKVYREAIISESLSLFDDAKEKLQEVQQISPSDSEYYRKASDKLKNYLE